MCLSAAHGPRMSKTKFPKFKHLLATCSRQGVGWPLSNLVGKLTVDVFFLQQHIGHTNLKSCFTNFNTKGDGVLVDLDVLEPIAPNNHVQSRRGSI